MNADCKHQRIQTWRFEDSAELAGLWSCTDCGRRFEPVAAAPVADHACTTSAVVDRQPLADAQIAALPVWAPFVGLWPEMRIEIARAIEAAHGIGDAA
jgi:hypothetical protein